KEHASEKYYYEVYFYIVNKYIHKLPIEIVHTIEHHVFLYEERLSDLKQHLDDVSGYIDELQANIEFLKEENITLSERHAKEKKRRLIIEEEMNTLNVIAKSAQEEK